MALSVMAWQLVRGAEAAAQWHRDEMHREVGSRMASWRQNRQAAAAARQQNHLPGEVVISRQENGGNQVVPLQVRHR